MPSELYVPIWGGVRFQCCQCIKSFRSQLLVSVHIYNQHSFALNREVKKAQFGFLGGLLPPKPSEAFKKKAAYKNMTLVKPKVTATPTTITKKLNRKSKRVEKAAMVKNMEKVLENWLKTGKMGDEKNSVSKSQTGKSALSCKQTNTTTALSSKSSAVRGRSRRSIVVWAVFYRYLIHWWT